MNPYETKRYLNEYLLFHYGRPKDLCPFTILPPEFFCFHERIREECLLPGRGSGAAGRPVRALDIGCAVGRFSFELSPVAGEVVGIDNAASLIRGARALTAKGSATIKIQESGEEVRSVRVGLPKGARPKRVRFEVVDAQELDSFSREPFDIVAAINLLCRIPRPAAFLRQLSRLVRPGGQLVIASPFSWLPEYTAKRQWLNSSDVEKALAPSCRLARTRDLPFVIREHRRKYQLVVSQVMTFSREA
jgi:SAM-dependent methyltransferase